MAAIVQASSVHINRRNAFKEQKVVVQQRVENTLDGAPLGHFTEWATVASFSMLTWAEHFIADWYERFGQPARVYRVEFRIVSL